MRCTNLILTALALGVMVLTGCGSERTAVSQWAQPGMHVRILNPGAKHLDAIVTRETFNKLFPQSVWFQEGDVVGMYNRETRMTFVVVSQPAFDHWTDELSVIAEHLCHEKSHRADDLYEGDTWAELRDTSAPGLALDTHHYATTQVNESIERHGVILTATAPPVAVVAMAP